MRKLFKEFRKSEDGAITVDWVVLTATVVFFVLTLVLGTIGDAVGGVANSIATYMNGLM
ncbi:hypothetical protein [Parasulfitobacter algicola]|uniref:Flp pilus assembly protein, pilin Flp n=1 Tax=Parasulfitobacter algicola TaxID=2614809 RepID=A0ABX2IUL4_9RHOB|nr:hypothetical protein [Sulfitobacter algicola]NSX56000.1 hypothetical protein [Sulfitobacter algicola]